MCGGRELTAVTSPSHGIRVDRTEAAKRGEPPDPPHDILTRGRRSDVLAWNPLAAAFSQDFRDTDEAVEVLRYFVKLKTHLMPYLLDVAREAQENGWPMLRGEPSGQDPP